MKRMTAKLLAMLLVAALMLSLAPAVLADGAPEQPELVARVKNIIEADGLSFKDLNDNGELDPYEDWRLSAEERADDLLSKMDAVQMACQMGHPCAAHQIRWPQRIC